MGLTHAHTYTNSERDIKSNIDYFNKSFIETWHGCFCITNSALHSSTELSMRINRIMNYQLHPKYFELYEFHIVEG